MTRPVVEQLLFGWVPSHGDPDEPLHETDSKRLNRSPALPSRGTPDALPHNGGALLLFPASGLIYRESCFDMVMTVIVTSMIALAAVLVLVAVSGSF